MLRLTIGTLCFRAAHLGVFIGLGAIKVAAIDHGGVAPVQACGQPPQIAQVCLWWHISSQCVCVPCTMHATSECHAAL